MREGDPSAYRKALISAISALAAEIEANPPPVIASDILVQASPGASAIGSLVSVTAGPGASGSIGQRIIAVGQPGRQVIGQRITVVAGGGQFQARPPSARSHEEIDDAVAQLREAANALASGPASKGWIEGILKTVSGWGALTLNAAVSAATRATIDFYANVS